MHQRFQGTSGDCPSPQRVERPHKHVQPGVLGPHRDGPGVNLIKHFQFITDEEAKSARGFALRNPFQSGLRI
jgi:hypothetical protein